MGIENWLQDVQTPNSSWQALSELIGEVAACGIPNTAEMDFLSYISH